MCPRSSASTSSLPSSVRSAKPPPRASSRARVWHSPAPSVSQPCHPAGHTRAHWACSHTAHRSEGWGWHLKGVAPEGGGIGASSQPHLSDVFPWPCAALGRDFPRMQWHIPFSLHIQSPSHSKSASPCRLRWPVPLSLVQAATLHSAAPGAGCVCQAPNSASPSPSRVDSWLVETSAERTINCKGKRRTSRSSGW